MKIFSPEKTVPRLPTGDQPLDPAGDSNPQLQLQVRRSAPPKTNFWLRLCAVGLWTATKNLVDLR